MDWSFQHVLATLQGPVPREPDEPSGYVGWGTMDVPEGEEIFPNRTPEWMYEDPPPTKWSERVVTQNSHIIVLLTAVCTIV